MVVRRLIAGVMLLCASRAEAFDLPKLWGKPLALDVTEVSIVAQRFDSRETNPVTEGGAWGQWVNRLNAKLDWNHFELGVRLDSALYWNTLKQQCHSPSQVIDVIDLDPSGNPSTCHDLAPNIARDDLQRYQNSIYPAKLWATYKRGGIEITLGDAYVQFARGLVLSMRKLDDLGVDNTVRGFKAAIARGPLSFTLVGGLANPSRVDEATGQALFVQKTVPQTNPSFTNRGPQPVFGADQIFGAEIQAGRQTPVVLTTSMSYVNRCAPTAYTSPTSVAPGRIITPDTASNLFGYCDDASVTTWLGSLPGTGNNRQARHVTAVAQSIELPKIGKLGSLYVVGVIQQSDSSRGTALYATYTGSIGKKITNTLEFKDYRSFLPAIASIDATKLSAFGTVQWSSPPTIESIQQDNMIGNFDVCVDGVRLRTDVRTSDRLLVWGQGILSQTRSEQSVSCDTTTAGTTDWVADGVVGFQYGFDAKRSHAAASVGARGDWLGTGDVYIYLGEIVYDVSKAITRTVALELSGRHRVRFERALNIDGAGVSQPWIEGENYLGLTIAPRWVITQGFEYTTLERPPTVTFVGIRDYPAWLFVSLGGIYKFTRDSNIKLFVGQQRGGLKCISGVCRIFPDFEGARMELTLRF
jgi:hypothetical protein